MDINLSRFSDKSNFDSKVSSAGLGNICKIIGHFSGGKTPKKQKNPNLLKERFKLLWKSKRILKSILPPKSAILGCMHYPISDLVEIDKADGDACIHNVVTCKSRHVCPVEAPTISALESQYIQKAVYQCRKSGKDVYMLTLTFSHYANQSLERNMSLFHRALAKFWENGSVKRFYKTYFHGRITALEETWGNNGWHVHEHILLFGQRGLIAKGIGAFWGSHWVKALSKVGLSGLTDVACNFQSASEVKSYLTKMGNEMTMFHYKKGRAGGHYTPFQLLAMSEYDADVYADLWREYYKATKGKRAIVWSDGLKKMYGIEEKSDDELAEEANNQINAAVRVMVQMLASDYVSLASPEFLAFVKCSKIDEFVSYLDSRGFLYGGAFNQVKPG